MFSLETLEGVNLLSKSCLYLGGKCVLIPIFATHSLQAQLNRAQPHYGLNSCIILYFILLNMVQAHATTYLEN